MVLEFLASALRQEEEVRRKIRKKEIKLFFFTDDMIVYIENAKESTIKLRVCPRKIIRKFDKVTGYKVNTPTSIAF